MIRLISTAKVVTTTCGRLERPTQHSSALSSLTAPRSNVTSYSALRVYSAAAMARVDLGPAPESSREYYPAPTERNGDPYWQKIGLWKDVPEDKFLSYSWQVANNVQGEPKLVRFLNSVLPEVVSRDASDLGNSTEMTRDQFIEDVVEGIKAAPMAVRLTPHTLSVVDWNNPLMDPIRRQFIPMKSKLVSDHPQLTFDSLGEEHDSPVPGIVHRYPDKALFLATSVCPVYCRFCTRSYAVGANTSLVTKASNLKPTQKRWDICFDYIERTPTLTDIVVSGGDTYYLQPHQLKAIGERLLSIPHIRRFRFATKGLAVCPSRILDPNDDWTRALIEVSDLGRRMGKAVAVHTHFNHPNEITWVTTLAARKLFEAGVTVRNQSVLLRGVNDDVATMKALIRGLADICIIPYYLYQGDMVRGVEDLRTPLSTILDLECQIRGTIAGFMMPQFVVDLPGGGGKRLANSYTSYDRLTGVSKFVAPAVAGGKGEGEDRVFEYHDPVWAVEAARQEDAARGHAEHVVDERHGHASAAANTFW